MEKNEIEKLLNMYYEDCILRKRLSDKTLKAYKIDLHQFFSHIGEEIESNKKINEYVHHLNVKYPKYKTVKRKIASVKAFYAYLEFEELIEITPFRKVRTQIKEPKLLPRTITVDYIEKIFGCLYKWVGDATSEYQIKCSVRNAAAIELLFATGIRISELCNLRKKDINLEERTVKIFGKGSKERILYVGNDSVIHILNRYKDLYANDDGEEEYFFLNKYKKRMSEQSVRILLDKLESSLAFRTHITPHMFRHTFATMLLEKDVDIRYIQKILGHSSISITQIYTHVSTAKQKEILSLKNPRNDIKF